MAGLAVIEYLAPCELDRFLAIVRRYSHDILSPAANLAIGAEVCGKLLRRRAAQILADPSTAEACAQPFDALLQQTLEFPKAARFFVWGPSPDDQEATRAFAAERWQPYDASVWDIFVAEYIAFISAQLERVEARMHVIEQWMPTAPLTPPDQSADFRSAVEGLRHTLDDVWKRLEPHSAEQHILPVINNGSELN